MQGVLRLRREASALTPSAEALGELAAALVRAELPGPDPKDTARRHLKKLLKASRKRVRDLERAKKDAHRELHEARKELAAKETAAPLLVVWGCSLLVLGVATWALGNVIQDPVWELFRSQELLDGMGLARDYEAWKWTRSTVSLPLAASLLAGPTFASLLAREKHWLQRLTLVPELLFSGGFGLMRVGTHGMTHLAGSNSVFELSLVALHVLVVLVVREALPKLRERWDNWRAARGKAAVAEDLLRDAERELGEAMEVRTATEHAMEERERAERQVQALVDLAQSAARIIAAPDSGPEGQKAGASITALTGRRPL